MFHLNEMLQKHFQNKFINMKTDINAFLQNVNKCFNLHVIYFILYMHVYFNISSPLLNIFYNNGD